MITNKRVFANIMRSEGYDYYRAIVLISYDIQLFGKTIKHIEKESEVPFYFKTLEIAKDFCEVLPDKIEKHVVAITYQFWCKNHIKRYETYKLYYKRNKNKLYVYWDEPVWDETYKADRLISTCSGKNNILKFFTEDISISKDYNNAFYRNSFYMLSDGVNYLNRNNKYSKNAEEYKFELISQ